MFSSSNGSKKPVQQVCNAIIQVVCIIQLTRATVVGDGSGWSVYPPRTCCLEEYACFCMLSYAQCILFI